VYEDVDIVHLVNVMAIFREVLYKGWSYRDITKVCELMHIFKALSYLTLTSQVLTSAVWLPILKNWKVQICCGQQCYILLRRLRV